MPKTKATAAAGSAKKRRTRKASPEEQAAAEGLTLVTSSRSSTGSIVSSPTAPAAAASKGRRLDSSSCGVRVLPMAALTKGREGREMTELGFLLDAGAVGFTDCDHVVTDTKVLSRALTRPSPLVLSNESRTEDGWS